jgi:hypothetical protein
MLLIGALVHREVESRFMKISIPEVSKKSAARRTRYFSLNKDGLRYSCVAVIALIFFLNFQKGADAPIFTNVFKPKIGEAWSPPKTYTDSPTAQVSPEIEKSGIRTNWNQILMSSLNLAELPKGIQPSPQQLDSERLALWKNCLIIESDNPSCNSGSVNAKNKIYIFGDSYALALSPMVFGVRTSNDYQVISRIRGQCMISSVKLKTDQLFQDCLKHRSEFYLEIQQKRPYLVIASSLNSNSYVGSTQDLYNGIVSEYEKLVKYAKNVIVVGETPFGADPRVCPGSSTVLNKCYGSSISRLESRLITEKAAKAVGANYVDISSWVCVNGKCPVVIDGVLSTYDGGHMTQSLSGKLSPLFKYELAKLGLVV